MNLKLIEDEIYNVIVTLSNNVFLDELPLKDELGKELDYINKVYVTYRLLDIDNGSYRDNIFLEVQVVSNKENKIQSQDLAINLDKKLNRTILSESRIIRQNAWFIPATIDDKYYATLQYYVLNYK